MNEVFEEMQRRSRRKGRKKNWNYNTGKLLKVVLGVRGKEGWRKLNNMKKGDLKAVVGKWEQENWWSQVQKEEGLAGYREIKKGLWMSKYLRNQHGLSPEQEREHCPWD